MSYLFLSIVCSVAVSVLLKLVPRWRVDVRQVIAGNYLVAGLLCWLILHPAPELLVQRPTQPAWRILLALGILLPSLFLVLARSVQQAGVVRTDAAQRLSLVVSLIAAFTLFGENLTWLKLVGVALGLAAMACLVIRRRGRAGSGGFSGWIWPLLVFAGAGVIDILFKRMAQLTAVPFSDVLFATFLLAFVLSGVYITWRYLRGRAQWRVRNLVASALLGVLNFGNILFYIQAHRHFANNPTLVFSTMNIGVIVLATTVGVWGFGERPGRFNRLGLMLAIAAVIALATAA